MRFIDLFKRVAPFLATFAVGLFVASFFVTVSAPRIEVNNDKCRKRKAHHQLRIENEQLREEKRILEMKLKEVEMSSDGTRVEVYEAPVAPPAPPTIVVPYQGIDRAPLNEQEARQRQKIAEEAIRQAAEQSRR